VGQWKVVLVVALGHSPGLGADGGFVRQGGEKQHPGILRYLTSRFFGVERPHRGPGPIMNLVRRTDGEQFNRWTSRSNGRHSAAI
jgi:hypothetical protein